MQLTLDADPRVNLFRAYSADEVRVGNRVLRASCIITADAVIVDWRPVTLTGLTPADLEPIFALQPDVVLLGAGETQQFPSSAIRGEFTSKNIALETMTLGAACRTFNILVQEGRKVAAALVLEAS